VIFGRPFAADPLTVGLIARHPAPVAVVAAALAATAVVFAFFRPQYHPKGEDSLIKVDMSRYPPPSSGWNWTGGQPGFRFGEREEEWDFSGVQAAELAPARAAARQWGVAPSSVRLLDAIRIGPGDLNMIVAGTNAADHTCIGFVTPGTPVEFYCPDRLESQSGLLLLVKSRPYQFEGQKLQPAWLMGIQRADVERIVVDQPFDRNRQAMGYSYWGAWELSLGQSPDAVVTAYLRDGTVRRAAVNLTRPGDRVIPIPG
jgi:hypothetical protein